MKITIEMVMAERPCSSYPRSRVEELWAGREWLSAHEVTMLDIPLGDIAWLLSRMLGPRDTTREVARRIVRYALGDREIPQAYRAWLDTGDEALRPAARDAARNAAGGAAWSAARGAARNAAGGAAWSAAMYAARNAAWGAAWSAAMYAAWDAAMDATWDAAMDAAMDYAMYAPWDAPWDAAWDASRRKYISWMADWLYAHECRVQLQAAAVEIARSRALRARLAKEYK